MWSPDPSSSIEKAVGAASVPFGATMTKDDAYLFVSSTACWIAQGTSPVASAGAGSMYVPANVVIAISGRAGADVAVIQDSVSGKASLTRALR